MTDCPCPSCRPQHQLEQETFEYEFESGSPFVRWVQSALNRVSGLSLAEDGIDGPATRSATRAFQQRQGLAADGVVGPRTEAALVAAGAPAREGAISPSAPCPPATTAVDCPSGRTPALVLDDFAFDSAAIVAARHRPPIIAFARRILASQRTNAPIKTVLISGHTDAVGTDDYNFALARRRAEAVALELCTTLERMLPGSMKKLAVQLTSCGERETKPAAEASRRVELFVPTPPRQVPPKRVPPRRIPPKRIPPKRVPPTPNCRPQFVTPPQVPLDVDILLAAVGVILGGLPLGSAGVKLPTTVRFLSAAEQCEAMTMFAASLDFRRILISDGIGAQNRPFTVAVPSSAGIMVVMNLGDIAPWEKKGRRSETLIHELTHAWQSQHHGTNPAAFMVNSVRCQGLALADIPIAKAAAAKAAVAAAVARGVRNPVTLAGIGSAAAGAEDSSAYAYVPGKPFSGYAAEQIAQQIEDAYSRLGRPTPSVTAIVRSIAMNVPSLDNVGSLTTISFERKSTPGVVFH
jgi:outer membrane protein OmpA-like peptidoglycan-associated protein